LGGTDEELMSAYTSGAPEAFDELLDRYRRPVFSMLMSMLRDRHRTEDVFQEVFLKVIRSATTFDTSRRFAPWLFKIADNACIEALRSGKYERLCDGSVVADTIPAPSSANPEKQFLNSERQRELAKIIAGLPEHQRQTLVLREFAGYSFDEISKILDRPLNTVLSHMHRALKSLRKNLPEVENIGKQG
jgi:RNA polymerase sigma-70 factor, ECF subfamily